MGDTVTYERSGRIGTITYNRPEALNAINHELRSDLNAAWEAFRNDDEAWVGIVTGAGRAFSAGADLAFAGAAGGAHVLGGALADFARVRDGGLEADDCGGQWVCARFRVDDGGGLRLCDCFGPGPVRISRRCRLECPRSRGRSGCPSGLAGIMRWSCC